jgi:hypothetical protein
MRYFAILCAMLAVASVTACRSDSGTTTTPDARPTVTPDAPPGGGGPDAAMTTMTSTIVALNMNPPARGTSTVTLNNVVVVASRIHGGTRYAEAYVQDPGGGMYSGMHIFCDTQTTHSPCTAAQHDMIKSLVQGDVISVTGIYDAFCTGTPPNDACGTPEVKQPTITMGSGTMAVTPITVDASMLAFSNTGLPLSIANNYVKIATPLTASNTTAIEFASTTGCTANGDAGTTPDAPAGYPYFGFEGTDNGATIAISFSFSHTLNYCLPDCPGFSCTAPDLVTDGEVFSSAAGIADVNTFTTPFSVQLDPITNADMPAQ